jgi:hypothetical protein
MADGFDIRGHLTRNPVEHALGQHLISIGMDRYELVMPASKACGDPRSYDESGAGDPAVNDPDLYSLGSVDGNLLGRVQRASIDPKLDRCQSQRLDRSGAPNRVSVGFGQRKDRDDALGRDPNLERAEPRIMR